MNLEAFKGLCVTLKGMKMIGFAVLAACLLAVVNPAFAKNLTDSFNQVNQNALEAMFIDGVPLPYQAEKAAMLNTQNQVVGFYAVLKNQETQSDVILVDIRQSEGSSFYVKNNLETLSRTLLKNYGAIVPTTIQMRSVTAIFKRHELANLKFSFVNGVTQLGLVGRLQYSDDRYIILLLVSPAYDTEFFSAENTPLRNEANELLSALRSTEKPLPSERYILWRLRRIFKRNP